jgi:hypothetical protein
MKGFNIGATTVYITEASVLPWEECVTEGLR